MLTSGVSDWFNVTSNSNVYGAPPVPLGRDHLGALFSCRGIHRNQPARRDHVASRISDSHIFGNSAATAPTCLIVQLMQTACFNLAGLLRYTGLFNRPCSHAVPRRTDG